MGRDLSYAFADEEDTDFSLNYIYLYGFHNKVCQMNDVFNKNQLTMLIIERIAQGEWEEAFAFMTIMHEFYDIGYNYVYIRSG
jgi:hypothetical protein